MFRLRSCIFTTVSSLSFANFLQFLFYFLLCYLVLISMVGFSKQNILLYSVATRIIRVHNNQVFYVRNTRNLIILWTSICSMTINQTLKYNRPPMNSGNILLEIWRVPITTFFPWQPRRFENITTTLFKNLLTLAKFYMCAFAHE